MNENEIPVLLKYVVIIEIKLDVRGVYIFVNYIFINLVEEVLRNPEVPLAVEEIWKTAEDKGLTVELGSSGKTPEYMM